MMKKRNEHTIAIIKEVGSRLKKERELLGLSQEEMAYRLGISDRQYRRYENGISEMPLDRFFQLLEIFNIDINYLMVGQFIEDVYIEKAASVMPEDLRDSYIKELNSLIAESKTSAGEIDFSAISRIINYGRTHFYDKPIRKVNTCTIFKDLHEKGISTS